MNTGTYEKARSIVLTLLKDDQQPDLEKIRQKVKLVVMMLQAEGNLEVIDEDSLIKDIETNFNIWIGSARTLDNEENHLEWLPGKRSQIQWKFWRRYERYLQDQKQWSTQTILRLDQITDSILQRLEDPARPSAWDRRGMVAGNVQSGKTANYTGLICKAVDAGYKVIIVLAGMHNSLRSQTQLRLDDEFLGFDTRTSLALDQRSQRVGVGLLRGEGNLIANSLTTSADNGDFNTRVARNAGIRIGSDPVLLVIKKYKSVLTNLIAWTKRVDGVEDKETGKTIIPGIPLLVIDDEADNASINTNPLPVDENGNLLDDYDVTAINGLIRKLLVSFEKSAYVGYTATPFANIFIYPTADEEGQGDYGPDLFPRSFITNLPVPSNYIGPARVFGMEADPEAGIEAVEPLPVVRRIDDYETIFPDKHKKDLVVNDLPASLKKAIRSFVISCAARIVRGQGRQHNSMLVHVTRFTAVQKQVADLISEELRFLKQRLEFGDGNLSNRLMDELKKLWNDDFVPTSSSIADYAGRHGIFPASDVQSIAWSDVRENLFQAVARIQVKTINGTAKDILDYRDYKDGLSVIAVGGDKLSRGLTLEGLSVSYYLRASRMYDTLMQMGRWFGYRPGYLDLCRLYTTDDLIKWYKHITVASEELRLEFEYMAATGRTPEDYGLRVRTHPDGLLITAVNKMRTGTVMQLSYARSRPETVVFHRDETIIKKNYEVVSKLVQSLGEPRIDRGNYIWPANDKNTIHGKTILGLMQDFTTHPESWRVQSGLLARYIETRLEAEELTQWTVALISNSRAALSATVGGYKVGLTQRRLLSPEANNDKFSIGKIVNPEDESIDLTESQLKLAKSKSLLAWAEETRKKKGSNPPVRPSGIAIREVRPDSNGLILLYPLELTIDTADLQMVENPRPPDVQSVRPVIGFAISFPGSKARPIEYRVNNVYWEQEFGSGAS